MKKTVGLIILLVLGIAGLFLLGNHKKQVYFVDGEETPVSLEIQYDMGTVEFQPWYDDESGIWYVFLPAFVREKTIDNSRLQYGEFYVDGEKKEGRFEWEERTLYEIVYGENVMQMMFLADENLSTLFIETESGSNDFLREAKENTEAGHMISLNSRGNVEYGGKIKEISGHGNAWEFYPKRAFDLKLNNKAPLARMEADNHWKLLHLWNDGDKIHSKLAFDIADILGAEYTPDCNWVNVYFNGEYHGMYLLSTAVRSQEIFESENVVFLEKEIDGRYEAEEHVVSEEGNAFVIHKPKEVAMEKKMEILSRIQSVEDSIAAGRLDPEIMDITSFVNQYLVEEIVLNSDGFETSAYLYQLTEKSPLCAGPPWDYDATFGECLHQRETLVNPAASVLDGEQMELTWYPKLLENPEFQALVIDKYETVMPELKTLYENTIDYYAEYIEKSVSNDVIRWKGHSKTNPRTGNYQIWENNVRYLKYFSMNRFNELKERWNIPGDKLLWNGTGKEHVVTLLYGGEKQEVTVTDGDTLELENVCGFYDWDRCVAMIEYSEENFSKYLPVLEDLIIKIEVTPEVRKTEEGKVIDLPVDMFAERQKCVSIFLIDSEGNTTNVLSGEAFEKDIRLEVGKEETGMIAIYVFEDENADVIQKEIQIEY